MEYPLSYVLTVLSVFAAMALLRRFLDVLPDIIRSLMRPRSGASLENNVTLSNDRNLVAMSLVVPFILIAYRYQLYNPRFIADAGDNLRLALIAAVFAGYVILRQLIYVWVRPRRRGDVLRTAHRSAYTHFIILTLTLLFVSGVCVVTGVPDGATGTVLGVATAVVFVLYLSRFAQILSLSCNQLRTFLYLCTLEILPASLLVASALVF